MPNAETIDLHDSGTGALDSTRHLSALLPAPRSIGPGCEPVAGYVIERRLGRGGFGEAWQAQGPGGVGLALKLIHLDDDLGGTELRALEFMRDIRHPQLIGIAGVWQTADLLVIAMELADGTTQDALDAARAAGGAGIEPSLLGEYLREAAKGIDYLNGMGIIHRDIKPQNLLLMGGGIKVADFGLARLLDRSAELSRLTMTPSYAAPEVCRGLVSERVDQYALAVTYCKLRGGRLPFEGNHMQVMAGHLNGAPDLAMIPEEDRPAVARALSKAPADRWPDCRSFVAALPSIRVAIDLTPWVAVPGPRAVGRRAFLGALGGSGLLAGAAVASAAWTHMAASDPLAEIRRDEIRRNLRFLRGRPFEPIRDHAPGFTWVDRVDPIDHSCFEILADERVADLRGWRDLPGERTDPFLCAVNLHRNVRVRKLKEADSLVFHERTSGSAIFSRCRSPLPFREVGQRSETYTGTQRQHAYGLIVDVAAVPVGNDFLVNLVSTFWDSLQVPEDLWFGVIGYGTASKVSQLIVFPQDKPFLSYKLQTNRLTGRDAPQPYVGPTSVLTSPDRDWINWDTPRPDDGRLYRIDWTW